MAKTPEQTIAKHFFYRKAILEYYNSSLELIDRKEFDIIPDNRFLFHGLDLDTLYVSFDERYEIVIYEDFTIKETDGNFIYVCKRNNEPVTQSQINHEIVSKLNSISVDLIPGFLTYQLKKYGRKMGILKEWKQVFENKGNFHDITNNWHNDDKQKAALKWLYDRIRKSDRRVLAPPKDIPLQELFKTEELLKSVLRRLEEKNVVEYLPFTGRYLWLLKGQDLAVFGEVLQKSGYLKDWTDYQIRRNALRKFFSVAGKKGYSKRTFQNSSIEDWYELKKKQFSFIRPI